MNIPECPKCRKPGVQERDSRKTGRPYLANVQTYPSGASYFRGLHTREECDAYAAEFTARVDAEIAFAKAMEEWRNEGLALNAQVAEKGYDAMAQALNNHMDRMPTRSR